MMTNIYVNKYAPNGIVMKFPLTLDRKIEKWSAENLNFRIYTPGFIWLDGRNISEFRNLFCYPNISNLYLAFTFKAQFFTPRNFTAEMSREKPTQDWFFNNGEYVENGFDNFGIYSDDTGAGEYSINLIEPCCYIIKEGELSYSGKDSIFPNLSFFVKNKVSSNFLANLISTDFNIIIN
ncbi:hypothetical protein B5C26_09300 [Photorhabdus luminescens]|uniref:hypothetical protein n=1 Tax=Photorhabdus luminescens TaxID=29488 RepID=UPI000B717DAF|nr:hypothetical protein [Photorhabdus luminescens]OWO82564.1 hypothetical protein B5C26_09300 [Photorhabdus luminescens]